MEIKKNKELYDAPATQIFEVKIEGIVCQSAPLWLLEKPTDYEDGGDPFAF